VADEIAGFAEVVTGKLGGRPLTVVRGLAERVLPAGEHGPGARSLVREVGTDMFGLGSREAVVAALAGGDRTPFGAPASAEDLEQALTEVGFATSTDDGGITVAVPGDDAQLNPLLFAFGWQVDSSRSTDTSTRLTPLS